MIYFSELRGKKVVTEDEVTVGKLEDLIFFVSENPILTKIVIRSLLKEKMIIPMTYVEQFGERILIKKEYIVSSLEENELHLVKNLLDKQIIDLKGNKIVRVNDVAIQDKGVNKEVRYIAGVDIGLLGILRGLKLEDPVVKSLGRLGIKLSSSFLSWGDIQPLELVHGAVKLRRKEDKLQKIRPEDLADYLEKTNITNVQKFLKILDEKKAAEVIDNLNLNYRAAIFRNYKPEKAAKILTLMEPNDAVDVLLTLPSSKRMQIIGALSDKKRKEFEYLIRYSTTEIGNLLTTEYLYVSPKDLVIEVIKKIHQDTREFSLLNTIYVRNEKKELIGVFNLHELLLQDVNTPVYKFMIQNVIVVYLTTPAELALKKMLRYLLATVPVIDKYKNIIGIISINDLIDVLIKEGKWKN